jgi:hypothetical protein
MGSGHNICLGDVVDLYNKFTYKRKKEVDTDLLFVNLKYCYDNWFGWEEINLYSTGSYYFKCQNKDSDRDWMAEYDEDFIKVLESLGFKRHNDTMIGKDNVYYDDPTIVCVYTYEPEGSSNKKDRIDVQLVTHIEYRLMAREILSSFNLDWNNIPHESRCKMWKGVLTALLIPSPIDGEVKYKAKEVLDYWENIKQK